MLCFEGWWSSLKHRGFSLIEVLFALGILAFGVTALTSVLLSTFRAQDNVTRSAAARALGQRLLDRTVQELPTLTFSEEDDFWKAEFPDESTAWKKGEEKLGSRVYSYYVTAVNLFYHAGPHAGGLVGAGSGATENGVKFISVHVRWHDGEGSSGSGRQELSASQIVNRAKR